MATAKKTPAAAPVAKPKAVKLKSEVQVTRRNGEVVKGKVTEIVDKPNGRWITVNTSTDKKKPALVTARVSQVAAL